MQPDGNETQLVEVLNRGIQELEKVETDPRTLNFVARRVGNIVKHMRDLREDLRPRGRANGNSHGDHAGRKPYPATHQSADRSEGLLS